MIACENTLPGDPPSDWQVNGAGDPSIQGFATQMSLTPGQTESFKIKTPASSYHIDILRVGYYQGNGARKVVSNMQPTATLPQSQPACTNDSAPTGLIDCGNWAVSASWTVPSDAVSGLYLAHLVRDDTVGESLIPFVVRDDASHSDILFQTSDETWQAYNSQGGNSLYSCTINCPPGNPEAYKGAAKVSYNRPWHSGADDNGASWFMYAEYPMIRFLEANGYDVRYTSGLDVSQPGYAPILEQHKVFMSTGHDEYWSGQQRTNIEAALAGGVNLAFFSGNEIFWKTRWEPSIDGSNTPNRTLVTYKETHFDAPVDPLDPPTWTGTWMDPRFSPPADGGLPQNALTGQLFDVNSGTTDITVPSQYSKLRFWRNTPVAGLPSGGSITLDAGVGTLGYEWDVDADNGFRPPGLFDMSATTTSAEVFTDYGSNTQPNSTATHHLTLYRAASGALVFGGGTVQWSWGLDNGTGSGNSGGPVDPTMQQATVNLFADMGNVQPATLMNGLTPATQTTDTSPPTTTITSPSQGATFPDGTAVTISGTATDAGGGVVAGVEVSTDGSTWHPATTMSAAGTSVTWSYSWIAHGYPTTTINALAVDDSGNRGTQGPGDTVNVTCPCSIWGTSVTPEEIDSNDSTSVNVGVKFQASIPGTVTGIRFYKASANIGTHIGELWTATGQQLATATFTNETGSGWQEVDFSQPVAIDANTIYIASYFAPNGHYSDNNAYFYTTPPMGTNPTTTTVNSPPLQAPRNTNGTVNGVYSYAGTPTFPTSTFNATNYWVDVIFQTPTNTPTPTPIPTNTPTPTPPAIATPTPTPTIQVIVQTNLAGLTFTVDNITYSSTQTFSWVPGSSHTIGTISPQNGATGVRYVWTGWTGGGAISHTVAPTTSKTYTATFSTQYFLTTAHGTGGTVSPASGWQKSGVAVAISATAANGYSFGAWSGSGSGSYSGTNNPGSITMNAPITENASFIRNTGTPTPTPTATATATPTPPATATPTPTPTIQVIVQTNLAGLAFSVDGTPYSSTQTFSWVPGSSHTIATTSPQNGGTGVQYVWSNWTGGGTISHTVAPTTNNIYTATFSTQYYLTMSHGTGGTVSPASNWKASGSTVSITATPASGYTFAGWTGSGAGSYSGTNNPVSITMNGPITENASFTQNNIQVTVQTNPAGLSFSVDGTPYSSVQTFSWVPGSSHTIATTSPQSGGTGVRYVWSGWTGGGAISHTVAPTTSKIYTANFSTQYFLTMAHGTGGTVSPASGWKNSGVAVSINAMPGANYHFSNWTGSGTGSFSGTTNPASITMGGPISETGTFTHN